MGPVYAEDGMRVEKKRKGSSIEFLAINP